MIGLTCMQNWWCCALILTKTIKHVKRNGAWSIIITQKKEAINLEFGFDMLEKCQWYNKDIH